MRYKNPVFAERRIRGAAGLRPFRLHRMRAVFRLIEKNFLQYA